MRITIGSKSKFSFSGFKRLLTSGKDVYWVAGIAAVLAIAATAYFFSKDLIVAYGDAESHLNIAKRVVESITPGFAQLGGIWLPLPHLLMIPFVYFDPLWKTGLAGSIVSGAAFVISSIYLYKTALLLTKNKQASFFAFLAFATNPNILYLQATPMTELPLILFFILSTYHFLRFIYNRNNFQALLLASLFGFCASLTRYDGWFLVLFEAGTLILLYGFKRKNWKEMEGKIVLFSTLAFLGIAIWFLWDYLILGDPLYFTNSQFSAHTQQLNWLKKGQLPAFHNFPLSFAYYLVTAMSTAGLTIFLVGLSGVVAFFKNKTQAKKLLVGMILLAPFAFYVFTLYVGQAVIFIPHLTPVGFEWRLFNVRYGAMMIPVIAIFFAYMFLRSKKTGKLIIIGLFLTQFLLYGAGYSKVVTLADGIEGLSQAKRPDAEQWFTKHYDGGLVLLDDYARTTSIIRSNIPMKEVIYVGNHPYWDESLVKPEKYATWIVMQKNDDVWKHLNNVPKLRGRLYTYFSKAYTSPDILIFKRNAVKPRFN